MFLSEGSRVFPDTIAIRSTEPAEKLPRPTAIKSWRKDLSVQACLLLRAKFVYIACQNITVGTFL